MSDFKSLITIGKIYGPIPKGSTSIRCDRKTPLGNPFYMKSESQRDEVCDKFEVYLKGELKAGKNFLLLEELARVSRLVLNGRPIHLQCWCYPKRCHTLTIRNCILSIVKHMEEDTNL